MEDDTEVRFAQEEHDFEDCESEEEDSEYVPELVKMARKDSDESSSEDESGDEPPSYILLPTRKKGVPITSTLIDAVPFSRQSESLFGKNQTEWKSRPMSASIAPKIIRRGYGKPNSLHLIFFS